jgi:hypothetical protein
MVSVIAPSMEGRRFKTRSGQSKTVKSVFVASPISQHHLVKRANNGWLRIRKLCPSEAACCISELAQ